jgi:hypothetical protein
MSKLRFTDNTKPASPNAQVTIAGAKKTKKKVAAKPKDYFDKDEDENPRPHTPVRRQPGRTTKTPVKTPIKSALKRPPATLRNSTRGKKRSEYTFYFETSTVFTVGYNHLHLANLRCRRAQNPQGCASPSLCAEGDQ